MEQICVKGHNGPILLTLLPQKRLSYVVEFIIVTNNRNEFIKINFIQKTCVKCWAWHYEAEAYKIYCDSNKIKLFESVVNPSLQVFVSSRIVKTAIYCRHKFQYWLFVVHSWKRHKRCIFSNSLNTCFVTKGLESANCITHCYISCPKHNLVRCLILHAFFLCPITVF